MATITKLNRPDGVVYKARVRRQGQDGETSKTFLTRTAAKRWALKLEAAMEEDAAGLVNEGQKHTLEDAIKRFRREILPERSTTTRPTYEGRLAYWEEKLGHLRLSELTAAKIGDCRDALKGDPADPDTLKGAATVKGYLAVLSAVLTTCVKRWHWLKDSPMDRVEQPSIGDNKRKRFLSTEELRRLLDACRESSSPDLYPAVLLSITTGARRGELLGLRWKDVDLAKGVLTLRVDNETETKGGERTLRIATQVQPLLSARLAEIRAAKDAESKARRAESCAGNVTDLEARRAEIRAGETDDRIGAALVFPSRVSARQPVDLRKPWETALKRAEIENFRWHDLRHSAASFMAANGASLLQIGDVLGHKSAQTTKRYAHLTDQSAHVLVQSTADSLLGGVEG
jgi:integrase